MPTPGTTPLDARHRAHAEVEDRIRCACDTGRALPEPQPRVQYPGLAVTMPAVKRVAIAPTQPSPAASAGTALPGDIKQAAQGRPRWTRPVTPARSAPIGTRAGQQVGGPDGYRGGADPHCAPLLREAAASESPTVQMAAPSSSRSLTRNCPAPDRNGNP